MCCTGYVPFIGDWRSRLLQSVRGLVLEVGAGSGPNLDHLVEVEEVDKLFEHRRKEVSKSIGGKKAGGMLLLDLK